MKLKHSLFLIVALVVVVCTYAQQYTVGTYNVRLQTSYDTGNLWVDRAPYVSALIRFHDYDVFGTQEGFKNQLDDMNAALPQYSRYGVGRDDGGTKGEHAAIFYKKDKFELLQSGDFWLSQTPDVPSKGWDATCCNRICSWVYLKDKKTGKRFYFFNVHYDHQGVVARQESSKLILEKINAIAGSKPVILTGDFNGSHSTDWYKAIANSNQLRDTYFMVKYPYANNSSFSGFKSTAGRTDIIDHVFVSSHFTVNKWGLLTDTYHGKYPSDHFPVLVEVKLK